MRRTWAACLAGLFLMLCSGCRQEMADQPRYEDLEQSFFFADQRGARDLPEGVVPRGAVEIEQRPTQLTLEFVQRGQQRYNIYCTPCHAYTGAGNGMAVLRGFGRLPPSFHMDRLREAPDEHFYDVITNGFGAMYDYSMQIAPRDRWAIVAYIRALQLSQGANINSLPAEDVQRLGGGAR